MLRVPGFCSTSSSSSEGPPNVVLPDEPTNCCMSGCANCVWIDYARDLTRIYADGGSTAQKLILEKISDPALKVFLQMELKTLQKTPNNSG